MYGCCSVLIVGRLTQKLLLHYCVANCCSQLLKFKILFNSCMYFAVQMLLLYFIVSTISVKYQYLRLLIISWFSYDVKAKRIMYIQSALITNLFLFYLNRNSLEIQWLNFTSLFCVCGPKMEHLKNLLSMLVLT